VRSNTARAADVAFVGCVALGLIFLVAFGALDERTRLLHANDFSGIWVGARALVLGIDPYDPAGWRAAVAKIGTQTPDTDVYGYPPWIAVAFVPLALVPLEIASWSWTLGTLLLAIIATRSLLRAFVPSSPLANGLVALTLTMSTPAYHTFILGQWGFALIAALVAGALAIRDRRDALAATILVTLLAKPQLFLATPLGLLTTRRAILIWSGLVLAIVALTTFLVPNWLSAWLTAVPAVRLGQPASLYALLTDVTGQPGVFIAAGLAVAGAIVASRFARGSDASRAAWLSLSSAVAPYEWAYDHLILLVPIVIAGGVVSRRSRRGGLVILAIGCGLLLYVSLALYVIAVTRHRETLSAVVPAATFVLIAVALWPDRRR
jgi:glycosyl transferase family 87